MDIERNEHQIICKDARACFVETLNDSFEFGKVHFCFASCDMKLPAGQRQTNSVHIYVAVDEFSESVFTRRKGSGKIKEWKEKDENRTPAI